MSRKIEVLLIEDDAEYAMLINAYVHRACGEDLSYVIEVAETLGRGMKLLEKRTFDIVLLDLVLPDSEGLETVDKFRAGHPGVPIIVLTNMDKKEFGLSAIARGAQDFLVKHQIDAERLRQALGFAYERTRIFNEMEGVVGGLPDGVIIVDQRRIVRFANEAAARILCRDRGRTVNRPFEYPFRPGEAIQIRVPWRGGENRTVETRAAPIQWRGDPAWIVNLRDITDLTKLERLRAEIKERRRMDTLKDALLSTVSHELRTPLAVVHGVISTLREGMVGGLNEKQNELIHRADRQMNRLSRLLTNFLDLSRLESGRALVKAAPLPAAKVISEVLEGFSLTHKTGGIFLRMDVAPDLPMVYADPDMFEQVLDNLLDNASRFAVSEITVAAVAADPGEVQFAVVDDGAGLSEEKYPELFDKFVQLDRPSSGAGYKGTGLGLSICKEIVGAHGGRIWGQNVEGRGAGFFFTLPTRPPAAAADKEKGRSSGRSPHS